MADKGMKTAKKHLAILMMRCYLRSIILVVSAFAVSVVLSHLFGRFAEAERVKDIANFEGVRDNQLIGYGLAVGINGDGDKGKATLQAIANMLQRMGLTIITPNDIKSKNTAAVMVTAKLPPFAKPGTKINVTVSTIGDCKTLQGSTLLLTPLKGPDDSVYAVAQGPISVGGFLAGSGGTTVTKNHVTAGMIPEGAIIEREPAFQFGVNGEIRLFLNKADFTTANAVRQHINSALHAEYASTVDPSSVRVRVPEAYAGRMVELVSIIENLDVPVDTIARVVVNERTGTVVIGDKVKISPIALAHGNLTIDIKTDYNVSQPAPFAPEGAKTVVTPDKDVTAKEQKASLHEVAGTTLGEIVKALNAIGVTPRDLISILQALRTAGALRADLELI